MRVTRAILLASLLLWTSASQAGPFEDANAAYQRKDYVTAAKLYSDLASGGNALAQGMLGVFYQYGLGVPQDFSQAAQWYAEAAKQGLAPAQVALGNMYSAGLGVPQDYSQALSLFSAAAGQGDANGENALGDLYFNGNGVAQNYATAESWYRLAGAQGNNASEFSLGFFAYYGLTREKNYAEAVNWFYKSAQQENAGGEAFYGFMLSQGYGVPQNYDEAFTYFIAASKQGSALGQAFLGEAYFNGRGAARDYMRAYMWLSLSASSLTGSFQPIAINERDQAAANLNAGQVEVAQQAASRCVASGYQDCLLSGAPATTQTEDTVRSNKLTLFATGSGFLIDARGDIVTADHVVHECAAIKSPLGQQLRVVAESSDADLAILAQKAKATSFAHIETGGAKLGEGVVVVGFPLYGLLGKNAVITTGIVSSLSGIGNDRHEVQISAPVQEGNSGGPLLGESGGVIGVVVSKLDAIKIANVTGDIPENVNFAVNADTLTWFLRKNSIPVAFDSVSSPKTPKTISAEASQFTVLLQCWK